MPKRSFLAVLTLVAFLAALAAPVTLSPPTARYCTPIAFRDRVVGVGYQAVVRAAPGCKKPVKVRKENTRTGSVIGDPNVIPVGEVQRVWLFTHRLRYTLDDRTYQRLEVR
ncbi:hypothetical protein [Deinococcus wulumuqiensis]|uniref:Uncharacterized protein n=1 Tax=Deinococcus wulumuqiensis TaxID=980427 RepID=A0AAV4K5E6_9DEIO|nr:hypothetical protein [Deinococcus wulumuqiensis]QII20170.1 hypothetical protein G6R31_04855 [Deinococcus wulumuqiensis R12]GGI75485.1 hypothetical protein GCM10010914_07150 [Deinococcus wulumuqiensis]GGP28731.1 hypothetical protein GCM10008021_03820 [Deinococcus wulumuqiensis]